MVSRFVGHTVY